MVIWDALFKVIQLLTLRFYIYFLSINKINCVFKY